MTPVQFLDACSKGKIQIVKEWIRTQGSLEITDRLGRTALMLASEGPNEKIFTWILTHSPENIFNAIDSEGQNALFYACRANSLKRVAALFEKKVKVICSKDYWAFELAQDHRIHALLKEETERETERHAVIMKECFAKYESDPQKMAEEIYRLTGRTMKRTPWKEYSKTSWEKAPDDLKAKFFSHPQTVEEVKAVFDQTAPRNSLDASTLLQDKFGLELERQETKEILAQAGVKTKKDILNESRIAIRDHFKQHPPKSLQEAGDYIEQTYQIRPRDELLTKFLQYCGINFV